MVDEVNKRCGHPSCSKLPSLGMAGTKRREMCTEHALDGMVSVKRCCHPNCLKLPLYASSGNMEAGMYVEHPKAGMNYPARHRRSKDIERGRGRGCGVESGTSSGGRRRERDPPASGTAFGLGSGNSRRCLNPGGSPDLPIVVEDAAAEGTMRKVKTFVYSVVCFTYNDRLCPFPSCRIAVWFYRWCRQQSRG